MEETGGPSGSEEGSGPGSSAVGEEVGAMTDIKVKTLVKLHSFTVPNTMLMKDFKAKITKEVGISLDQQVLVFKGRVLEDETKIREYNQDFRKGLARARTGKGKVSSPPPAVIGFFGVGSMMKVTVRMLVPQTQGFTVPETMLVKDFKMEIAKKLGVPFIQLKLIFRGTILQNEESLGKCDVVRLESNNGENPATLNLLEKRFVHSSHLGLSEMDFD